MAAKKFLRLVAGVYTEIVGVIVGGTASQDGDIPALDANGKLDVSLMPVGLGPEVITVTTSEALSAGDIINLWDSTGLKARKADANAIGTKAHGYVLAGYGAGAAAVCYIGEGEEITGLAGLTIGATYYLSASTPGGITSTPPTGTADIVQKLGVAISATVLIFSPGEPTVLA